MISEVLLFQELQALHQTRQEFEGDQISCSHADQELTAQPGRLSIMESRISQRFGEPVSQNM